MTSQSLCCDLDCKLTPVKRWGQLGLWDTINLLLNTLLVILPSMVVTSMRIWPVDVCHRAASSVTLATESWRWHKALQQDVGQKKASDPVFHFIFYDKPFPNAASNRKPWVYSDSLKTALQFISETSWVTCVRRSVPQVDFPVLEQWIKLFPGLKRPKWSSLAEQYACHHIYVSSDYLLLKALSNMKIQV